MDDNEPEDEVVFDATIHYPAGVEAPSSVQTAALSSYPANGKGAGTLYDFGDYTVTLGVLDTRQIDFDKAVDEVTERLRSAEITETSLRSSGATLHIRIALVPEEGMAGLYLQTGILAEWSRLGANLLLNAWPGGIWADTRDAPETEMTSDSAPPTRKEGSS